jgi:membrane associated rhomboid family serine protease
MNVAKKPSDVPVSTFLGVTIVIIFSLYFTSVITSIPSGKDVMSQFASNFVHADIYHLFSNLFSLYALSRIEVRIGPKAFFSLIAVLLISNSIVESIVHTLKPDLRYSIGFSGVLFGIASWEIVTTQTVDMFILASIGLNVVRPSLCNDKISLAGHSIGAVTGVIMGLLWAQFTKSKGRS